MRSDDSAVGGGTDRYRRQRRIQEATYAIAQAVTSSEGLDDLYARIHRIVAGLMEARNLYIALLDDATGSLTFPYFRDEIDAEPPAGPVPVGRGLTGYVLRKGEPLLASPEVFDALVARGEVEPIGAASIDWLGVPLRAGDRTIGVLAVQSYAGNLRYGEEDQALLGFVSSQVALAIERRRAEEALRQSERSHRALLEALPDLLFVLGRDGRYKAVHAARPETLAAPRETLLGTSVPTILPPAAAASLDGGDRPMPRRRRHPGHRVHARRSGGTARVRRADRQARRGFGPLPRPGRHRPRRGGASAPRARARAEASHRQHARRHLRDGPHGGPAFRDALLRGGDGLVAGGVHRAQRPRFHPPGGRRAVPGDARAEGAARRARPPSPTASGRRAGGGSGSTPS